MMRKKIVIDLTSITELLLSGYRDTGDVSLLITAKHLISAVERLQGFLPNVTLSSNQLH